MTDTAGSDAPFVRADVAAFLRHLNALPGPRLHELPVSDARRMYLTSKDVGDLPVGDLAVIRDLAIPGPAGPIPARLFDAREARAPGPVVVFFHGGGFVIGDLVSHGAFTAQMARALDLPVIAIDYRRAPEAPWPAAPDDCEAAARWIADRSESLGISSTGLVLAGDSAGGTLAIVTAMALRNAPAAVPVIVQALIYPATDMARDYPSLDAFADGYLLTRDSLHWFDTSYAADAGHVRASPIGGVLAGMPPAVIVTAGLDPIRDQGRAYAAALIEAGVPVVYREAAGNIHGFITLRRAIPSSVADVASYLAALKTAIDEACA